MRHGNAKRDLSRESSAKRKRRQRRDMRAAGFKLMQFWVHPDDRDKVLRNLRRLRAKRMPDAADDLS